MLHSASLSSHASVEFAVISVRYGSRFHVCACLCASLLHVLISTMGYNNYCNNNRIPSELGDNEFLTLCVCLFLRLTELGLVFMP